MKYNGMCYLIILSALMLTLGLQAQSDKPSLNQDINAPIAISAKSTFVDGVSKMSVYQDDVVVVQAGLTINAARLSIDASAPLKVIDDASINIGISNNLYYHVHYNMILFHLVN